MSRIRQPITTILFRWRGQGFNFDPVGGRQRWRHYEYLAVPKTIVDSAATNQILSDQYWSWDIRTFAHNGRISDAVLSWRSFKQWRWWMYTKMISEEKISSTATITWSEWTDSAVPTAWFSPSLRQTHALTDVCLQSSPHSQWRADISASIVLLVTFGSHAPASIEFNSIESERSRWLVTSRHGRDSDRLMSSEAFVHISEHCQRLAARWYSSHWFIPVVAKMVQLYSLGCGWKNITGTVRLPIYKWCSPPDQTYARANKAHFFVRNVLESVLGKKIRVRFHLR